MRLSIVLKFRSFLVAPYLKRFRSFASTKVRMQVFTQKRNPITGSTEWDVQHEDYDYHQEIARSAFADMLHDTERNKKYYRALQLAIEKMHGEGKQANVLDIGTGTGLLSIMAARCGADSIVACEAFKPMAECCAKILERNGVADKITLIPKRSTELTVGEDGDMKQKANILVTEVFDTELIGEDLSSQSPGLQDPKATFSMMVDEKVEKGIKIVMGALSTFSHAHQHLLEEDCIVVPDSAVVYVQLVECPTMQKWNKLNDLADEDLQVILRTPQKMKDCAGSAAVHDIQLSQLPRQSFRELSDPIPVFYYDWSGRSPIDMKRTVKQEFTASNTGRAQMVFMWWDLNMDSEGRIVLSCAPWWTHPDANLAAERPQDSIPWRDHWMQAVYYLPQEITLKKDNEATLISCQDEYSLWFYLEDENSKHKHFKRPICECGVHMALSRTHVSYLNDGRRSKKFLSQIKEDLVRDAVVLDLNGSSFLGLAAAKMGAKKVYILENQNLKVGFLNDYVKENGIGNVDIVPELNDEILHEVTNVVADPNFSNAILPWENLKIAYMLYKHRSSLCAHVSILPEGCEFWAMPVQFLDLQKIRIPLGRCEGIDMMIFDELVENSRVISDAELEPQPLWEYPCRCRGVPRKLIEINFRQLQAKYATNDAHSMMDTESEEKQIVNGFAIWVVWKVGGKPVSAGPGEWPAVGGWVTWDMHSRQAVKILKRAHQVSSTDKWSYQLACDLERGQFNVDVNLILEE